MLTDPLGVLAAVPSVLGFEPSPGDLAAVYLDEASNIHAVARVAAADLSDPHAITALAHLAARPEVLGVVVAAYGVPEARASMLALAVAGADRCRVVDVLAVDNTTWRSTVSDRTGSMDDAQTHPTALTLALAGRTPVRDRDEHAAHLTPHVCPHPHAAGDATDALLGLRAQPAEALAAATTPGARAALATLPSALEHVLAGITRATAPAVLADWSAVVRAVPAGLCAGPLTICAVAAFASGDGTSMRTALRHLQGTPYGHPVIHWLATQTITPGHPDDWADWKAQHLANAPATPVDH